MAHTTDRTPGPFARPTDRLMILGAALLFSTGGAVVKLCSLAAWQVASLRSGIAVLAFLVFLPSARRAWTWRIWLVGIAYAATMILYVLANKLTTAANAIFLQSTAPLYILLLSPLLLHERVRRNQLGFMAALAGGMTLFFIGVQPVSATAPDPVHGNILGVAAGLSWALSIIGLRWLGRDRRGSGPSGSAALAAAACGNLIAFLIALPMALPIGGIRPLDWAAVVFLGIFQIALAYVFLARGIHRVSALEVSLLLLLEPV
ncbi:MAG: DMT family transporter, partial [Thermoanaerobaculales bacterium]